MPVASTLTGPPLGHVQCIGRHTSRCAAASTAAQIAGLLGGGQQQQRLRGRRLAMNPLQEHPLHARRSPAADQAETPGRPAGRR